MLNRMFEKYSDWALVFVRLSIGLVFFVHGIGKLFNVGPTAVGISGTATYFANLGIPEALFFAWIVALVETFGGLFIFVGLFTRYAALGIAIDMVVAILLVHLTNGFFVLNGGYEYPLVLLLGSIALLFSGGGKKLVLEKKLFGNEV